MKIILDFTEDEVEKFEEMVGFYQDEGPPAEGWASDILSCLRDKIETAIDKAKGEKLENS